MELTVSTPFIKNRVLPALRIVAGLVLTCFVVLSEVNLLHGRYLFANSVSKIFERYFTIAISIEPLQKLLNLLRLSIEAPISKQCLKMSEFNKWMPSTFPFNESFFNCFVLSECPWDEPLLHVVLCNYLWNFFLELGVLFLILLHIKLVLRVFLRVVSKIKVFGRLDAWSKPLAEVTVRDFSCHSFRTHLDKDLKQCVVEVSLLLSSNELC